MKVGLIPTGTAELLALPDALARLFPGHQFEAIAKLAPDRPYDGFTGNPVGEVREDLEGVPTVVARLVAEAASQLDTDTVDLVVMIDDLELANRHQPARVLECMRAAVTAHLARLRQTAPHDANALAAALKARASFHLAVPMLEAWFFADPTTPARIGIERSPQTVGDPEDFATPDPEYAADDCHDCTAWRRIADPLRRRRCCPEWDRADRCAHPKAYLAWLLKDPRDKRCSAYRESDTGVRALRGLEWQEVLRHPERCAYARAFVEDLSIALNEPLPWLDEPRTPALTRYAWPGKVLRNV